METVELRDQELNDLSKDAIMLMYKQQRELIVRMSEDDRAIREQNERLLKQVEELQEKVSILLQKMFGRSSEKGIKGQLSFDPETMTILNEAEKILEGQDAEADEPDVEEVVVRRKKQRGKRAKDLEGLPRKVVEHTLPEERLKEEFPNGWKRLPDEVSRRLEYNPATVEVREDHIAVYASKGNDGKIVKADRPGKLLNNSLATPSMAAAVINGKYVDAMPLNRISEDFHRLGVDIPRNDLARWMIRLSLMYLYQVYDAMKEEMLTAMLIHCDETPFKLVEECRARGPDAKCYMWVYHTSEAYGARDIYIYEYEPTRNAAHPREFLAGYKGILMTDGYQVYHTLGKERPDDLTIAGCWAHAKRKYTDIIKGLGKKASEGTAAAEGNRRIQAIYHVDNMYKGEVAELRLKNRQTSVKPLVDAYFAWVRETIAKADKGSRLYTALNYSINQEQYLREFLDNAMIPLDNNDAERSIRKFCVGKHSWHIIDSVNGAKASAILYSIAETARANDLQPYEYFKYVLEEFEKPETDQAKKHVQDLLPWSESLPGKCRLNTKAKE